LGVHAFGWDLAPANVPLNVRHFFVLGLCLCLRVGAGASAGTATVLAVVVGGIVAVVAVAGTGKRAAVGVRHLWEKGLDPSADRKR